MALIKMERMPVKSELKTLFDNLRGKNPRRQLGYLRSEGYFRNEGKKSSPIWFCGIERTGKKNGSTSYHKTITELLSGLIGKNKLSQEQLQQLIENLTLRINLYPIGKSRAKKWGRSERERTGCPTLESYKVWCFYNFFPVLRRIIRKYPPKVVVCAGISSALEFAAGLTESGNGNYAIRVNKKIIKVRKKKTHVICMKVLKTTFIIAPFLGG